MLNKIGGLPAHVLLIHAVVVLLPLSAGLLVASAVWPAARRRLGILTPALALVVLILVPITTKAGEWLQRRLPPTAAIDKHVRLGHGLLPWALGIFVLAALVWLLGRRYDMSWRAAERGAAPEPPAAGSAAPGATATLTRPTTAAPALRRLPVWATALVAVLAVGVSVGGVTELYRIGESGAKAVWGGIANLPDRSGSRTG
jgi:hypothetical protein